ncbi:hypothetical protein I302_102943 [Kwoniella bestiolae CBS 10118]|uniref:Uncharacterized protein n=1 Tax=Kwoniella bestiolae CBS 10118 TaxID=1296100 RepID=A0A1B9GGD2_9TREE|nr:hypothetical protein I302_01639 [Kwoniella bestiolae CBS 10118]OCF30120.1 hypothetical protein I302_01639 [Kwoniella bestiolae CBS 10118]
MQHNGQREGLNFPDEVSKFTIKRSTIRDTLLEGSGLFAEALETLGLSPASPKTLISEKASSSPYSPPLETGNYWSEPAPTENAAEGMDMPEQEEPIIPLSQGESPSTVAFLSKTTLDEESAPPIGSGCGNCLNFSSNGIPAVCQLSAQDRTLFEARYQELNEGRTDQWARWSKRANWSGMMPICQRCKINDYRCNFPEIPKRVGWDRKRGK